MWSASLTFLFLPCCSRSTTIALQCTWCPVVCACSATADLSKCPNLVSDLCSLTLCAAVLRVSPTYTFLQSPHPIADSLCCRSTGFSNVHLPAVAASYRWLSVLPFYGFLQRTPSCSRRILSLTLCAAVLRVSPTYTFLQSPHPIADSLCCRSTGFSNVHLPAVAASYRWLSVLPFYGFLQRTPSCSRRILSLTLCAAVLRVSPTYTFLQSPHPIADSLCCRSTGFSNVHLPAVAASYRWLSVLPFYGFLQRTPSCSRRNLSLTLCAAVLRVSPTYTFLQSPHPIADSLCCRSTGFSNVHLSAVAASYRWLSVLPWY